MEMSSPNSPVSQARTKRETVSAFRASRRSYAVALASFSWSFGVRSIEARALERAVDCRDCGLEHRRDVADREVEHVVKDEGRALARWE
jgi:hypothetical protein